MIWTPYDQRCSRLCTLDRPPGMTTPLFTVIILSWASLALTRPSMNMAYRLFLIFIFSIGFPLLAASQKANQTITFNALPQKVFGDPAFELSATASSNLPVTYTSSNAQVATIAGTTVTIVGAGQATIVAQQSGNEAFNAAPDVSQVLQVAKASQIITFPDQVDHTYGEQPFQLGAASSSGLPLSYSVSDLQVGSVFNGIFFISGSGECTVTATQPGNNNYLAAVAVSRKIFIRKADQVIDFAALPVKTFGEPPFTPIVSASSSLPIVLTTSDPTVAIIQNGKVTLVGAGVVDIVANQPGNADYSPATTITRTLTVNKAPQTIQLTSALTATYGSGPITLAATATSGEPVTFSSQYDTIAAVTNTQLVIKGAGTTEITARHPGNANFLPAQITQVFTVNKASQTITFSPLPTLNYGAAPYTMIATASSGLKVSFNSTRKAVAVTSGNALFAQGLGTADIVASQGGNANFLPAPDVSQPVTITGTPPVYPMFGSTRNGGTGKGTLFKVKSNGSEMATTFHFPASANNLPNGGLIKASDGKLYGVIGAAGSPANGVVFSVNTDGTQYTILHNFSNGDGSYPTGNLVEASNGYLYGATMYGGNNVGVIFRLQKDGSDFSVLHMFSSGGYNASAGLVQAADGKLYGATLQGGSVGYGSLYSINLDGSGYNEFVSFDGASKGSTPRGSLVQGPDLFLYGVTNGGGSQGKGVLFKVKTDGTSYTKLIEFDGVSKGANGAATPLLGSNGKLYAMTQRGGTNDSGIIFSVSTDGTGFTKLLDLNGTASGKYPLGSLIEASDGYVYGMTSEGGANNVGVSFKIMKDGNNFTKLLDFNGTNGASPQLGPLLEMQPGLFIGMTYRGGPSDAGIIFTITSTGTFTLFKDFPQPAALPESIVSNGNFNGIFGLATSGGTYGGGAVFTANNDGTGYQNLVNLQGDFLYPVCLTRSRDNTLWGVGREGVISFNYFLFRVNEDGTNYQRIAELDNPAIASDTRSLIDYSDEYMYGISIYGGVANSGTIYKIRKDGTGLSKVTDVPGGIMGSRPFVPAIKHSNGSIYGVAHEGGANNSGVVFKVSPDGVYSKIADLSESITGTYPLQIIELNGGTLCVATGSKLFSVDEDGKNLQGFFELEPSIGANVRSMVQSLEGYIYVSLASGGASGMGSMIRVLPDGSNYSALVDFNGSNGSDPNSLRFEKQTQTITSFEDIVARQFIDPPFLLNATSSSGALIRFTSSDPSIASVNGYLVTLHKIGTVTILAQVPGSGNFLPSPIVSKTFTITKSDQQLSFSDISPKVYGDPDFKLVASTTSQLPISFSSSNTGVATVNHGVVTITGTGSTTITATVVASPNFNSVPALQKTLTVAKGNQDLLFYPLADRYVDGDAFILTAGNSSGLPVTFGSSDLTVATISGNTATLQGAGETTLTASALGNSNYLDATVNRSLMVKKHDQFIDFESIDDRSVDETAFSLQRAVASSGLLVTVSNTSPHISMVNDVVTILGAGRVTLQAMQSGNSVFLPATPVSQSFCIIPAKPVVTANSSNPAQVMLTSSAATGNEWLKNGMVIPGAQGQTFIAQESGVYTARVSIEGCSGSASEPIALVITGVEERTAAQAIYPNPAETKIVVQIPQTGTAEIQIFNLVGMEMKSIQSTEPVVEIDIRDIPVGLYLIRTRIDDSIYLNRFVKK